MSAPSLADIQVMLAEWGRARPRVTPTGVSIPADALPVSKVGSVQAPAFGAANQVVIVEYQVKPNWEALLWGLVLGFQGALPVPRPGDIVYSVDVDKELGSTTGHAWKDFGAVGVQLGDLVNGPTWPVEFRQKNGEVVRIKGFTVANVSVGAGNFLTGALVGHEWPMRPED
jgi:hypothetical protein